jgi:uncharacterized protein
MAEIMHDIINRILRDTRVNLESIHGFQHWARVERNGLYLCRTSGADVEVVRMFAFLHDCQRHNDSYDPQHGPRAAEYARSLRGTLIRLDDDRFTSLHNACAYHTHGRPEDATNPTIATCWDADRLDIGRVSIMPHSSFLATEEARRIADARDYAALKTVETRTFPGS